MSCRSALAIDAARVAGNDGPSLSRYHVRYQPRECLRGFEADTVEQATRASSWITVACAPLTFSGETVTVTADGRSEVNALDNYRMAGLMV